jgi:hypothetical protein
MQGVNSLLLPEANTEALKNIIRRDVVFRPGVSQADCREFP